MDEGVLTGIGSIADNMLKVAAMKPVFNVDFLSEVKKRMGNGENLYTNIKGAQIEIEWQGVRYLVSAETIRSENGDNY